MMIRISAGLLMFNRKNGIKVFLVHPGGPFFMNKDDGFWGIPKGLIEGEEIHLEAAEREFEEETGIHPSGNFIPLGDITQKGGKVVFAWAFEVPGDDPVKINSNTCEVEWPPKSGKTITIPEVDKGEFFTIDEARIKMNPSQHDFLDRLLLLL